MKTFYDAIYLSPHLDDAVLSGAGQIYQNTKAGESVLVVSITAADPPLADLSDFARTLHDRWELSADVGAVRRNEDADAAGLLGADYLHLDFPDCIYRKNAATGEALYASEEALFGDLHPAETILVRELAGTLANLPAASTIFSPLTVGNHVDHQLTRLAAELSFGQDRLHYYEDFPYILKPDALPADLTGQDGWHARVIGLSGQALKMKIEAIACYRSQLSTFFRDRDDLLRTVDDHARSVGGERVWRRLYRSRE